MDTKALRQKILDLAIRGKLVPQNPNDEPADVLLERIREQKMQMFKEGKLKKKDIKNDTVIFKGEDNLHYEKFQDGTMKCIEAEIPFELPEGWCWCRLQSLSIKIGAGSTPTGGSAVYTTSGIKFIRSQNVYNDGLILTDVAYISEEINQKKSGSIVKAKDILLNITGGSIGRCALVPDEFDIANVNQHVMIIRLMNLELRKYIHSVIISSYIQAQILSKQVGSGRGGLSAETLSTFLIPLPPMDEQVSIIGKLNNCISQVLTIANEQCKVSDLISTAKSKILDLAIRGQLVPQDPNDEPASVLLERIKAEKEELIKQGKIKRDKKDSIIFKGDDNSYYESVNEVVVSIEQDIPFELPAEWTWCRIRNIASVRGGKRLPKGANFSNTLTDHAYIRVTDMKNWTINTANLKYISDDVYEQIKSYTISSKDLYVTIAGTIGVVGEVPDSLEGMNLTENAVKICNIAINKEYLCYALLSSFVQQQFQDKTHQVAMPKLALERILTTLIPLPPLNEQKKIVNTINKCIYQLNSI